MGALEAPLSSQSRFWDRLTFDLFFHLLPLLTGQKKVHMLSRDVFTLGLFMHAEIYRDLTGEIRCGVKLSILANSQ